MPTKFYLRNRTTALAPSDGEKSTSLPHGTLNANSGDGFENLCLLDAKGAAQTSKSRASLAQTAQQSTYLARFTSPYLAAQTIGAQTWTYAIETSEGNDAANTFARPVLYVWRPSTAAVVGFIFDSTDVNTHGVEWTALESSQHFTFSGSAVTCNAGDVLVFEMWGTATQAAATAYTQAVYFDGTADITASGTNGDAASALTSTNNIALHEGNTTPTTDNFAGTTIDTAKWIIGSDANVTKSQNDQLSLSVAPNTTPYDGLYTQTLFDFTGKEIFIRLVQASSASTGAEDHFYVYVDSGQFDNFDCVRHGTTVAFRYRVSGTDTVISSTTYEAGMWLRISEAGGIVSYSTAPPTASNPPISSDWTVRATRATTITITSMRVGIQVGCWQAVADPGTAIFDGFNTATATVHTMPAATASFAATGNATGFKRALKMPAATASFAHTGNAAGLKRALLMPISAGGFAMTGVAVNLAFMRAPFVRTGSFTLNTGAYPVSQSITGIGFTPKLIMVWVNYSPPWATHNELHYVFGAASSATARWFSSIGYRPSDGKPYMEFNTTALAKNCAAQDATNVLFEFDLSSFDADGFTISVKANDNTADAPAPTVFYTVLGGAGISAQVGNFNIDAAAGSTRAVTGVGFQPKALILAGNQDSTFLGAFGAHPVQSHVGIATGPGAAEQVAVYNRHQNVSPSNTWSAQKAGSLFVRYDDAGTLLDETKLSSFDADGFTLSVVTANVDHSAAGYIAIGGTRQFKSYLFDGSTATGNQIISTSGHEPRSLLLLSNGLASGTAAVAVARQTWGMGVESTSTPVQSTFAYHTLDNTASSSYPTTVRATDGVFSISGTSNDSFAAKASLTVMEPNSFTLNWSTAPAAAPSIFALSIGEAASQNQTMLANTGSFGLTGSAVSFKRGYITRPAAGSFSLTGVATAFKRDYATRPAAGVFTVTGVAAELRHLKMTASTGSFAFTGNAAALVPQHVYVDLTGLQSATALGTATGKGVVEHKASGLHSPVQIGVVTVSFATTVALTGLESVTTLADVAAEAKPILLKSKAGTIPLNSATGSQSVTGLGFTPKVVLFFIDHQASESGYTELRHCYGAATSSTTQWVASSSYTNAGYSSCRTQDTKCIHLDSARNHGSPEYSAAFTSMDDNGFTINVTTASSGVTMHYLALGGSTLDVHLGLFTTGTGSQSITGPAFESKAVLFASSGYRTDNTAGGDFIVSTGFATSSSKQAAAGFYLQKQTGGTRGTRALKTNRCYAGTQPAAGDPKMAFMASFTSHNAGPGFGFTINWDGTPAVAHRVGYVALGGAAQFNVLSFNEPASAGSQAVTGAGFTPAMEHFISAGKVTSTTEQWGADNDMYFSFGAAGSNGDVSTSSYHVNLGTSSSQPLTYRDNTNAVSFVNTSGGGTASSRGEVVSQDDSGFTLNWSSVTGNSNQIAALVIGNTQVELTGLESVTGLGAATSKVNTSSSLTGVASTTALGTAASSIVIRPEVTSVSTHVSVRPVGVNTQNNFPAVGLESVTEVGVVNGGPKTFVPITGVSSTSGVGTITMTSNGSALIGTLVSYSTIGTVTLPGLTTTVFVSQGFQLTSGVSSVITNESWVEYATGVQATFAAPPTPVVYHSKFGIIDALQGQWDASAGSDNGGWDDIDPPAKGGWKSLPPA